MSIDINKRFARLEALGLVRLECKPDEHATLGDLEGDMFNPECNPEIAPEALAEERRAFIERCNRDGVWGIVGEYKLGSQWVDSYSCWGFVGDDFKGSGYDVDCRADTVAALRKAISNRCRCCKGAGVHPAQGYRK